MKNYFYVSPVLKKSVLKNNFATLIITSIAFIVAVFQPFGNSPDYEQYEIMFQGIRLDWVSFGKSTRYEPGFIFVVGMLTKVFDVDYVVYGVLVAVAIAIKAKTILKFSFEHYFWLAVVFYFFKFFPLHELTQVRVALATSLTIYAASQIWGERVRRGAVACILAATFHYSSLMISPFLFLVRRDRRYAIFLSLIVFLCLSVVAQYAIGLLGQNMSFFQTYEDQEVNPVSPVFFPEFFIVSFSLFYWRDLTGSMQRIVAIQLVGFAILYALIEFPVVAIRGREFFSTLWVLFIAQGGLCAKHVRLAIYVFLLSSMILATYMYFYLDFFW